MGASEKARRDDVEGVDLGLKGTQADEVSIGRKKWQDETKRAYCGAGAERTYNLAVDDMY